jgi:hypothetical protein
MHHQLLSQKDEETVFYFLSKVASITSMTTTGEKIYLPNQKQQYQQQQQFPQWIDSPVSSSFQRRRSQWRRHRESKSIDSSSSSSAFRILFTNPLVLSTTSDTRMLFHYPLPLGAEEQSEGDYFDYGPLGLTSTDEGGGGGRGDGPMRFFDEENSRRFIYKDKSLLENHFREPFTPQDDDQDGYYALDDDYIRSVYGTIAHTELQDKHCRRTSDHRLNYQTCNSFHETPFLECDVTQLGCVCCVMCDV